MGTFTSGSEFGGIIMIFFLLSILIFILHVLLCAWAYRDARSKGRSQEFALVVVIGLFFFPVLGIIVYLLIRNDGGSKYRY